MVPYLLCMFWECSSFADTAVGEAAFGNLGYGKHLQRRMPLRHGVIQLLSLQLQASLHELGFSTRLTHCWSALFQMGCADAVARACGPQSTFPCEWSGSVLTPRNPTDPRYAHQPDFGSVQQISAMVARHWPAYFEAELGAGLLFSTPVGPQLWSKTTIQGLAHSAGEFQRWWRGTGPPTSNSRLS